MISDESQLLIRIPPSGNDETIAHADAFRVSIITEQDQKRKNKAIHSGANVGLIKLRLTQTRITVARIRIQTAMQERCLL